MSNEPKVITHLDEVLKDTTSFKKITELELTTDETKNIKYQLVSIDKLEKESYKKTYENLIKLNINHNSISILKLKDYNNLQILLAQGNQIHQVELYLTNLEILDLSKNNLRKLFDLSNIKNLRELNLSQNLISSITYDAFKNVKSSLTVLDLSENTIKFNDVIEFVNFSETFGKYMKKMSIFHIEGNPFTMETKYKDNYKDFIKATFLKLQVLNHNDIGIQADMKKVSINVKDLKEKMIELEKEEGNTMVNVMNREYGKDVTLKMINKKLLVVNQFGKLNDKTLEEIEYMVDAYIANVGNSNKQNDGGDDLQELDEFELFLDYIEKIIDSVSGYEKRLYTMIGKFSTVKYGKFTSRALSSIKQRISSDNSKDVYEVVLEIINFLKKTPAVNIPVNIIESLQLFLDEPMFITYMNFIMKQIMTINHNIYTQIEYNPRKPNLNDNTNTIYMTLYSSIISFFAKAIQLKDYVNYIVEDEKGKFIETCTFNLQKILNEQDDIIINNSTMLTILCNLLFIIRTICLLPNSDLKEENAKVKKPSKKEIITKIIGTGIRDKIEQKLRKLLPEVYKKSSLQDNSQQMNKRQQEYRKKLECTSLIQCFGALLSNENSISKYLDKNSLSIKIIEIIGQNEIIDPLLIQGSCDFTYFLLQNTQINTKESNFNIIASKLYNFRCLIPFLFPDSSQFNTICILAEKYGEKTCEKGKPIDLKYMNSDMINKFFISITTLMSFFGYHGQKESPIQKKCKEICYEMNNLKRDSGLTNCFIIPNEDVKLSIVQCFYSIDVKQLDPEELIAIYKQIAYLTSITGKMQLIVAIIFIVMNKWFLHNLITRQYKKIETCKEGIFLAMSLLTKNELKKTAFDTKHSKKTFLSAVLVMFLVNISCFEYTRKYFSDPKNKNDMLRVMQSEEESVNSIEIGFPLEIEKCHSGWTIQNLVDAMKGGCVNPYNYVSLRMMIHMGDVLMNRKYPMYELNYQLSSEELLVQLAEEMKKREKIRIKNEEKNWREINEMNKNDKYQHYVAFQDNESDKQKLQREQQMTFVKEFKSILEFVLCQSTQNLKPKLTNVWEHKFSKGIDRIKYSTYDKPKDEFEDDESNNPYEASISTSTNDNKEDEDDNDNIKFDDDKLYEKFIDNLREEDYGQFINDDPYDISFTHIKKDLFYFVRYGYEPNLKRISDEETPNNPYLRSLFLTAFLRCIYAILEHSSKDEKKEMIKILYHKDNIKTICLLIETTKFLENNIATKFLIIMKHVLRNTKIFNEQFPLTNKKKQDEKANDLLNKFGKISYMIKKIVRVFKKDFNIEKDEHKLLLSEVCQCSALIISQLQLIPFENDLRAKQPTIATMIDYEVISVFISIIKDYMNKEAESKMNIRSPISNKDTKKEHGMKLLQEMITINSNIIGEYMSRCPSKKYDILESFTRSYMFERCKMRKTLIKEIMECSTLSKLKMHLHDKLGNAMINLVAKVYFTKYNNGKGNSERKLMVITEDAFLFMDDSGDDYEDTIYSSGGIFRNANFEIKVDTISNVIIFDYLNHMLMQTKNHEEYGLFFYKNMNVSVNLKNILREINSEINFYDDIQTFPLDDFNISKPSQEISSTTTGKGNDTTDGNDEEQQEMLDDKIRDDSKEKTTIVYCKFEVKNVCDFFSNWFKKAERVKDEKVIVIQDNQLFIYEEKFEKWDKINTTEIFTKVEKNKGQKNVNDDSIRDCFNLVDQYSSDQFVSMKLIDADKLVLKRQGGSGIVIDILDDMSYVKIKHALNLIEEFDDFN